MASRKPTLDPKHPHPTPARAVPAQRPSELELLGLAVEDLAVDDHEARDARLFDALDWDAV